VRTAMAALVGELTAAAARRTGTAELPELSATLGILRTEYPAGTEHEREPLTGVADVFGLDPTDRFLLWAAVAPELDANVGYAYAGLRGSTGVARCTVALALELAGIGSAAAEGFRRLGPRAALRRHGLLHVAGTEPWGQRRLQVPDPVIAALAGAVPDDPLVAPLRTAPVPLELPGGDLVSAAVENGVRLIWIRSVRGAAGASMAAGALDALHIASYAVDLLRVASDAVVAEVLVAAVREAGLRGCALILANADALAERGDSSAFEVLARAAVPVIAVSSRPWNPSWLPHLPLLVDAERLDVEQRAALWQVNLGDIATEDADLSETLLGLRMNPESMAAATRYAKLVAAARKEPLSAAIVRDAARRVSGSGRTGAGFLASTTSGSGLGFGDLLLPSTATRSLHQLVTWARHRDQVAAQGLLRGAGRGIAALFAGNPGTGKTLAANIVAQELSMDLFQVELSSVVDKYIGETEKNLERVFQAAESLDVVLFFDEADALFGSRSEVHDARDRYANQEIAYLLQRMEQFDGITILATNLRGNLDRAFSRRMSFIISFPDPDPVIRRRLWEHHLDQLQTFDADDPIALDFLAETAELTGGDIRNIVRAAAFDAVGAGEPVGMRHIAVATLAEYQKLGRVLPEHGFGLHLPAADEAPALRG